MKNKIIFISLISIYIVFMVINTLLDIDVELKESKKSKQEYKIKDITSYQKDINLSNLSINEIWGVKKFKPKEINSTKDLNNSVQIEEDIKLRDTNGFYTIIISKKEFDVLGVVQIGEESSVILFDTNITKRREAIKKYYKNDIIYKNTRVQKIDRSHILVVDSKTYTKLKIPYFFVDAKDFKPKEESNDY